MNQLEVAKEREDKQFAIDCFIAVLPGGKVHGITLSTLHETTAAAAAAAAATENK